MFDICVILWQIITLTDNLMSIIEKAFIQYRQMLVRYVNARVEDCDLAEDVVQDAFVRVLEMGVGVREDSVKGLLFKVCRNLVCDCLRRRVAMQRVSVDMYIDSALRAENVVENDVNAREIEACEMRIVGGMPEKRGAVYRMARYEGQSVEDIADCLHVSRRTVEAHLFAGRREVREKMRIYAS